MKKTLHKLLSIALVICVLLSAFPVSVFAANEGTTTNGSYTDGVWSSGGTGSVTYNIDGTDVTLSKTAAPVAGMDNTFDITLSVRTSTTSISKTNAGAVVLVIDVSGSMKFCSVCGMEKNHANTCSYYQEPEHRGDYVDNSVKSSQSRLTAAKGAANAFLASYAGTDAAADRQLAIVTFSSGYSVSMQWRNVAGGKDKNFYNTASSTINGLSAGGGTNLEGGLYDANNLLKLVQSYGTRSVVLLTDGAPTYRMYGGTGTGGAKENNDAAQTRATAIKNSGASLYTICFGAADEVTYTNGPTVGNFLSASIASSGCAYNASNPSALYSAFAAISQSITSGLSGSGWTATDPMADMIAVSSAPANITTADGHTYTWTLDNAQSVTEGNTTTYVYTTTYRVTLDVQDENFVEGQFFPTNEETYLNIDNSRYAFPVPGVRGVLPRTDVTVTKQWSDNNNQDGLRPSSVTVQLKDGSTPVGDPVVLNASNDWTHTWSGLITKSKGVNHNYTVEEVNVPNSYTASYSTGDSTYDLIITNTHSIITMDLEVSKVWNDKNNQDGIRPEKITVNLLADGQVVASAELNAEKQWHHVFAGYDVYKSGKKIVYSVSEANIPEGYTASVSGLTITNTHETAKIDVPVTKRWDDSDNQDGIRPNNVTLVLWADGVDTGKTLTLTGPNWSGSFTGLDKFSQGKEIEYTITEPPVQGYSRRITGNMVTGFTVTNSHTPDVVSVSGSKTWDDNNNQDGKRPSSITIHLLANGDVVDTKVVTQADNWSWTFTNLPKRENGTIINYSIREDAVTDYTPSYSGYNITNTHTPMQVSVNVNKVWQDNGNQDGIRPNDITVKLLANGKDTGKTLVLSEGNNWSGSFTGLSQYENGTQIVYTIEEISVTGYDSAVSGSASTGFTVTNSHTPAVTSVSGSKTWNDHNNQDGKRPASITINLLANGQTVASQNVTAADNWTWSFTNLPKYESGNLISYSITEDAVDGYSAVYDGFNVTNSYTPAKTSVTVSKSWLDNNNQDGIRPNDITVKLLANGKDTGKTLVLNSGNSWLGSFTDLDKYSNGQLIAYTVAEVSVSGYTSVVTGDTSTGFTITNSHTPEVTSVQGSKTWEDSNNQDGKRPASITINLLANGQLIDSKEVSAADNWAWSFENLPRKSGGTDIIYSITENAVPGYTTVYNGYNVTNSYTPAQTSVTVTKSWMDNNNQDGIRPNDITVKLLADGKDTGKVLILSEGNNWTGSFTGLPKYDAGKVIDYSVQEIAIDGYTTVITETEVNTFSITNSHTPETTTVQGKKTWRDMWNQDGVRPQSITINLLANGKKVDSVTVTENDGWAWSFDNLPKKENGVDIVYTITEDAVDGYSTSYDGYNVTNKYDPAKISITVSKAWEDSGNQDGIRPKEVTVFLLANGDKTGKSLTLTEKDNWSGSFEKLDKFANGEEIVYTIQELEVPGYATTYSGNTTEGFIITNSHTPETITVSGRKIWNDSNDQDGARPDEITIHLQANGKTVATKLVTREDSWAWTFENLPKYENAVAIVYTVNEEAVEGYTTSYDGFNVINSYDPAKINIHVTKAWVDSNDGEKIRPEKVTIKLFADGEDTGLTLVLRADSNWRGAFEGLPKYAGGKQIQYTIQEVAVKGYNGVIKGSAENGFTVTNSHNYIPQTGDERTPIMWISMMSVSALVMLLAGVSIFGKKRKFTR